ASGRSAPCPDFRGLVSDSRMQAILNRRWTETVACMEAGADLAATVMMGGLLEGLFVARVNQLTDKKQVFTAASAPRDRAGKTIPQRDWTLKNYIEIAHELEWIAQTALDVGIVLRDYRNYIHPAKEFSQGVSLGPRDSQMLWAVFVALTDQ